MIPNSIGGFGVMFHHFYGNMHPKGQGAISADTLDRFLSLLKSDYEILAPLEFENKLKSGILSANDVVLTFDDSLKCQVDIALPVLAAHNMKAYFFVYSSAFSANPDNLEIFRYFRTVKYASFDDFFSDFLRVAQSEFPFTEAAADSTNAHEFLKEYEFYSLKDRIFRYLRDVILTAEQYDEIMMKMLVESRFNVERAKEHIFMRTEDLLKLNAGGHTLGLHSDTHPTRMDLLTPEEIRLQYEKNQRMLHSHTGQLATSMSHPCGRYNAASLEVLKELGVTIGFRSNAQDFENRTNLELPRIDHTEALNWYGLHD